MSMQEGLAPQSDAPPLTSTETVPSEGEGRISIHDAARQLSSYREDRDASPTEEAAPGDVSRHDTRQTAAPQAQPETVIDAPASWTTDEKERFRSLPPETQAYLTQRETERDTALRRGQNELAQHRQALQQQYQQIMGMRQQYEQILPALYQQYMQQQAGEFADIRTWQDAEKLAQTDWQRYAMWDAHQKKISAVQQDMAAAQQRHQFEYAQRWSNFASTEDQKFMHFAPEMSNPEEAQKIANGALKLLRDTGFSDDDLNRAWNGQASVSLRDHRLQLILMKAARYDAARAAAAGRKATPVPKVMRPGSPDERASDMDNELSALEKQLDQRNSGLAGLRNAADLLTARRGARRK